MKKFHLALVASALVLVCIGQQANACPVTGASIYQQQLSQSFTVPGYTGGCVNPGAAFAPSYNVPGATFAPSYTLPGAAFAPSCPLPGASFGLPYGVPVRREFFRQPFVRRGVVIRF